MLYEDLTEKIINACLEVMKELGAGYIESVYQNAVQLALIERGLRIIPQKQFSVFFHKKLVGNFFADLVVEEMIIVELKAVDTLLSDHQAQVINYLKASNLDVGLLVNFGKPHLEFRRRYRPGIDLKKPIHSS